MDLWEKKKSELLIMCREDKERYKGFSLFKTKEELINFIVSKNSSTEVEGSQESSDIGESLEFVFQEPLRAFGLNNELFRARPLEEELDKKILEVNQSLNGMCDSVTFEKNDDEECGIMYRLYKHKYFKKHKNMGEKGEMILFHGTDEKNVRDILDDDFSLTVSSTHGQRHGKGIYFTNCIDKALHYSEKMGKKKYVIVSLVHVGNIMVGMGDTGIHPKMPGSNHTFDTSVDNLESPIQFVKKCNGSYNIIGVLKFDMKERVNRYPMGGASGPPPLYPIGTKVEIIGANVQHGKTGVITSIVHQGKTSRDNIYTVLIDATSTITVPGYKLRKITNAPTTHKLKVTNDTDEDIKIYWIPKTINIYDPLLDIRQHGKLMGSISKGLTSSYRTYKGDKFMCANSVGYIRIIEINSLDERITIH
jgi:hypothetical protein